ncbi:hypothetical protein K435DRAFT_809525 [Dendrothele bispora CBS 962.96]|uniref:DUF6534 domain-containing protein n=1 Tax=Dendrothele bispora (strain CBS 962.96) TaxID=1314807 RepID=A0A4S8KXZ5_DENBC|nr:hypothetical protein K435DRAFT_809525 [Dendrothele bispora CBS 962.96]
MAALYTWVYFNTERYFASVSVSSSALTSRSAISIAFLPAQNPLPLVSLLFTPGSARAFSVAAISMGISIIFVQLFLFRRCWVLCQRWYFIVVLTCLFTIGIIAGFGCGIIYAVRPLEAQGSYIILILGTTSLVSCGITDVSLAIALVMLLKPMIKDSFREDIKQKVKQVLRRAISTGTLTAILKIVMLAIALFSSDMGSNLNLSLPFFLARIESMSMLFNLNDRRRNHSEQNNNTTTSSGSSMSSPEPEPEFHLTTINTSFGTLDQEMQHFRRIWYPHQNDENIWKWSTVVKVVS